MKAILRILPKRLTVVAVTLLLISILIFGITQILPGDAAFMMLGQWANPEALVQLREQIDLDAPF
jgi:peptide/nickel transport system permease protein